MQKARNSLATKLLECGLLRSHGLIGGSWVPAASGNRFDVLDPATGFEVQQVAAMGAEDAERAIGVAAESFAGWKGKMMHVRYAACCVLTHSNSVAVGSNARRTKQLIVEPCGITVPVKTTLQQYLPVDVCHWCVRQPFTTPVCCNFPLCLL